MGPMGPGMMMPPGMMNLDLPFPGPVSRESSSPSAFGL